MPSAQSQTRENRNDSLPDLSPIANHLWQSTLCAVVAWLSTLTLRKNPRQLLGTAVDMSDLALILSTYWYRPVLDRTGVQGNFDIAEAREPSLDLGSLPSLFTALEQQPGLRLESRKGPVESYVIDRVERPAGELAIPGSCETAAQIRRVDRRKRLSHVDAD
jgi:uncharacterized protein (TIGR03435 family)